MISQIYQTTCHISFCSTYKDSTVPKYKTPTDTELNLNDTHIWNSETNNFDAYWLMVMLIGPSVHCLISLTLNFRTDAWYMPSC